MPSDYHWLGDTSLGYFVGRAIQHVGITWNGHAFQCNIYPSTGSHGGIFLVGLLAEGISDNHHYKYIGDNWIYTRNVVDQNQVTCAMTSFGSPHTTKTIFSDYHCIMTPYYPTYTDRRYWQVDDNWYVGSCCAQSLGCNHTGAYIAPYDPKTLSGLYSSGGHAWALNNDADHYYAYFIGTVNYKSNCVAYQDLGTRMVGSKAPDNE